jgi:hypothetical protein
LLEILDPPVDDETKDKHPLRNSPG